MKNQHIKRILALFLLLSLIFSFPVTTFAAVRDDTPVTSFEKIAENSRISTYEKNSKNQQIMFSAHYSILGEIETEIIIDNALLHDVVELYVEIYEPDCKETFYDNVFSIGHEADIIYGMSLNKEYKFSAHATYDTDTEVYFGYIIIREKNDTIYAEYDFTHESHKIREYIDPYVDVLRSATETLEEFNLKFSSINELTTVYTRTNLTDSAKLRVESAAKVLSDATLANILYEAESNNSMQSADQVYDDDTTYGTIGYSGDIDYYKVQFESSGNANFWLGDIPSGVDYDFYLYDVNGNVLASSTTTADQEQIYNYPVSANNWYYMQVVGYGGSYDSANYYRVRAKNYPTASVGDLFEPNDDFTSAYVVSNNVLIHSANIHSSTDVDYFKFTITSSSTINITLSNIPSNCDYDLYLYNSAYTMCANSTLGGNSNESISFYGVPGVYYMLVSPYSGSSTNNYSILVSTTSSFQPDSYESNNTISTSTLINAPASLNATIHNTSDVDFYRFSISDSRNVTLRLTNITANCDYDLQLLTPSGAVIASSTNGGSSIETIGTTLTSGVYIIKVYSHTGTSSVPYRLILEVSGPLVYGNFSRQISSPTVPSNITLPLATIETEFDVWPAGNISVYYGLTNMQRAEMLTDIHTTATLMIVGGIFLPPSGSYLNHYLSQDGAEKTIDVYDFLDDDPVALSDMHDEINFALEAAEYLATSNSTISFSSINHHEFDPSKKGWIFSIGTYSTKLKCTVTRNGNQYTANIDYYLYDVYDWDRNITNMDKLPVSPRDMWELQYGGLAKGYYSNGIASFTVTWSTGQRIGAGASIS